jgi:hypothetical protein
MLLQVGRLRLVVGNAARQVQAAHLAGRAASRACHSCSACTTVALTSGGHEASAIAHKHSQQQGVQAVAAISIWEAKHQTAGVAGYHMKQQPAAAAAAAGVAAA